VWQFANTTLYTFTTLYIVISDESLNSYYDTDKEVSSVHANMCFQGPARRLPGSPH